MIGDSPRLERGGSQGGVGGRRPVITHIFRLKPPRPLKCPPSIHLLISTVISSPSFRALRPPRPCAATTPPAPLPLPLGPSPPWGASSVIGAGVGTGRRPRRGETSGSGRRGSGGTGGLGGGGAGGTRRGRLAWATRRRPAELRGPKGPHGFVGITNK